jgi:putative ABC transport system substrate-binding protein
MQQRALESVMNRRDALKLIPAMGIFAPALASAQAVKKLPVIAIPLVYAGQNDAVMVALRKGLRERGYVEGQNIRIEHRFAYGELERVPDLIRELAREKVDIFIAGAEPTARMQMEISPETPIVLVAMGFDPVAAGMVQSINRPGGNITGIYARTGDTVAKSVELLKELRPGLSKVAAFYDRWGKAENQSLEAAVGGLGVQLLLVELSEPYDYVAAFGNARKSKAEGAILTFSPRFYSDRRKIAEAAKAQSFPTVSFDSSYTHAGGLLSFGPTRTETWARAGYFIDRILKGEKPGDLPMEQPRTYRLVVNTRTAKALGLAVPESVMVRADEVVK